jgi:hypothetical protein
MAFSYRGPVHAEVREQRFIAAMVCSLMDHIALREFVPTPA